MLTLLTARTLADRYKKAIKQESSLRGTMAELEKNFTPAQVQDMKAEEAEWIVDVLDLAKHKKLHNPYEVRKEKGKTIMLSWRRR